MRTAVLGIVLAGAASTASGDLMTRRWGPPAQPAPGAGALEVVESPEGKLIRVDLAVIPAGTRIIRADLVLVRTAPMTGAEVDGRVEVEVFPILVSGATTKPGGRLQLRRPWFDRLDATESVRNWAAAEQHGTFRVAACPHWAPEKTVLDVTFEGSGGNLPPAPTAVCAIHRAGLTFISWKEIEEPFGGQKPSLGELRATLRRMEEARQVRYRVYRHRERIDRRTIADAELLAEVPPLSGWNPGGVSPDHAIHRRQLRAIEDGAYARSIASDPFRISPDSRELEDVPVRRLAIEDGKPLPSGAGLYVHRPESAGTAWYAVVTCIDGVANLIDLGPGSTLEAPVAEETGPGEPVLQCEEDLKVFYDYPGRRLHYVQWCAPGSPSLANVPNRIHDWSVYLPPATGKPLALGIYFHDRRGLYLRPRWQHQADEILIATRDAPWPTFGYGHHEALGTLRSFASGTVRDYTAVRIDAFVEWVKTKHRIDPDRIHCHGSGIRGGTSALHYGMRHADRVAWIVAGDFDANPGSCPREVQSEGRRLPTHLTEIEAVWGRREWNLPAASGAVIWDDRDLTSVVRRSPRRTLPFLSIGGSTLRPVWCQQVPFMKALLEARQPFIAEFDWGGSPPRYAPDYVRRNCVAPAVHPTRMAFADRDYWKDAAVHYSSGGSINSGLHWDPQTVLDTADRIQVRGRFGGAVTLRSARLFRPEPGEEVSWVLEIGPHRERREGRAQADAHGLVTVPGVGQGTLTIIRAGHGRDR